MKIFCCHCQQDVNAIKKSGLEMFGEGSKAASTSFFVCGCGNYVGVKKGKKNPSGNIPTHQMRKVSNLVQSRIKAMTDFKVATYKECSSNITKSLGFTYRIGALKSLQQAQLSLVAINQTISELPLKHQNRVLASLKQKGDTCSDVLGKAQIDAFCCGCGRTTKATLRNGNEIYGSTSPHLATQPFWQCGCGLYVGCHKNSVGVINPLGCIPTNELRNARKHIHARLDPLWQLGYMERSDILSHISSELGISEYHTGELRSIEQARATYRVVNSLIAKLTNKQQVKVQESYNLTMANSNR